MAPVLFRPSCGSDGADFMARWCGRCRLDRAFREDRGDSCTIAAATMAFAISDPEYPREWRRDGPSGPRCTAFEAIDPADTPLDPAAVVRPLL
jgi:hypothetical protein